MSDEATADGRGLVRRLLQKQAAEIERRLARRLEAQHELLVLEIMQRLHGGRLTAQRAESEWQTIDALSQLRAVVGGRFDNIKPKWEAAGFPLRAHRGDKEANFKVCQAGWIELSNWISSRGFEAKLGSPEEAFLFKVRVVGKD